MLVIAETLAEATVIARRMRPGEKLAITESRPATPADFRVFKSQIARPRKPKSPASDPGHKRRMSTPQVN